MGTDRDEIRKHLEERLKGTYSEAELDAIAGALEVDPDLLTPVTDPGFPGIPGMPGLGDPTGTVITIPPGVYASRDVTPEPHAYTHEVPTIDRFRPPTDMPFVEFRMRPGQFEELAQIMAEDAETREKTYRAYLTYEELATAGGEAQKKQMIADKIETVRRKLADWGCMDIEVRTRNNHIDNHIELTGRGYK